MNHIERVSTSKANERVYRTHTVTKYVCKQKMKTHTRTAHTGKKEHKWSTTGILSNHKCSQIWSLWFTIVNKIWLNIHTRYGWLVGWLFFVRMLFILLTHTHTHVSVCVWLLYLKNSLSGDTKYGVHPWNEQVETTNKYNVCLYNVHAHMQTKGANKMRHI